MATELFIGLASILVLGIFGQWLAWRIKIPAILPLLIVGLIAGPVSGLINPTLIFGDILFPFVSLAVGVILFEGGLTLKLRDIKGVGKVIWNLNTFGAIINSLIIGIFAHICFNLSLPLSLLVGSILMVTGPTVVGPLLRQIKLDKSISSILKWEGIIIDPIGAIAALLVFEVIFIQNLGNPIGYTLTFIGATIVIGTILGALSALLVVQMIYRSWAPDYLQSTIALAIVVGTFTASNVIQHESGLLTVTVMGIVLANQKKVKINHILKFKENLTLILISTLFIILSARLPLDGLISSVNIKSIVFLASVVFIARPVSIFLSTIGSSFTWQQKAFLSLTAPRGIVAAMIGSLFSLKLMKLGIPNAEEIVIIIFMVIIFTVSFNGLASGLIAKLLGVEQSRSYGVLIAGANNLARQIGMELQKNNIETLIVDTNKSHVITAKSDGLNCIQTSILSNKVLNELENINIGRLLALTPNDDLNAIASIQFKEEFGKPKVYRLFPEAKEHRNNQPGQFLFDKGATYSLLSAKMMAGAKVKSIPLTEEFQLNDFKTRYQDTAIPLFLISQKKELFIFAKDKKVPNTDNHILIALVPK